MSDILDILIIGGGPIGLACGLEAKKAGLSYLILEKGVLVNSLYHYPSNMTFFLHPRESKSVIFHLSAIILNRHVPKRWNTTGVLQFRRI